MTHKHMKVRSSGICSPRDQLVVPKQFHESWGSATAVNITPNWFRTPELRALGRFSNFPFGSLNLQLVSL